MADEAVLRIVLQDSGAAAGGGAPNPATAQDFFLKDIAQQAAWQSFLLERIADTIQGNFPGPSTNQPNNDAHDWNQLLGRKDIPVSPQSVENQLIRAGLPPELVEGIASGQKPAKPGSGAIGELGLGPALAAVAPAAAVAAVALTAAALAARMFTHEAERQAERYGPYSVDISFAQAMADMRNTFADLRRAQEIGPNLAEYITAQSRFDQQFEDFKTKLLDTFLPIGTAILELLTAVMPIFNEMIDVTKVIAADLARAIRTLVELARLVGLLSEKDDDVNFAPFNPLTDILAPNFHS